MIKCLILVEKRSRQEINFEENKKAKFYCKLRFDLSLEYILIEVT